MTAKKDSSKLPLIVFELNEQKTFLPVFSEIENFSADPLDMEAHLKTAQAHFDIGLKPLISSSTLQVLPGLDLPVEDFLEIENLIDSMILSEQDISAAGIDFSAFFLELIRVSVAARSNSSISLKTEARSLLEKDSKGYTEIRDRWQKLDINKRKNPCFAFFISYLETFSAKNDSVKAPPFIKNLISLYREKGTFISYLGKKRFALDRSNCSPLSNELKKATCIWKKSLFKSRYLYLRSNIYRGFIYELMACICFDFYLALMLEDNEKAAFSKTVEIMEKKILPYPGLLEYLDKLPAAGLLLDKFFAKPIAFKTLHNHIWR
jgi:hypothetical protein